MENWRMRRGREESEGYYFFLLGLVTEQEGWTFLEFLILMRNTQLSWSLILKADHFQIKFPPALALIAFAFTCQRIGGFKSFDSLQHRTYKYMTSNVFK